MTTLTITQDIAKKKLKLAGTVASGEKVAVTIAGFGTVATENLRLRVMAGDIPVGYFPLENEDAWTVSGADLTCTLNLATWQAERHCKFGAEVCFILEDTGTPQLYGVGDFSLRPWIKLSGVDVPKNLDNYKVRMDALLAEINRVDGVANGKYTKPETGIPKTDLAPSVRTSLDKADAVTLKVSKSAFDALLGLSLPDSATQKDTRQIVQKILMALQNAATCIALMFALPVFGIDGTTAWEDVPPDRTVKSVVEQFSPPADFSTNNQELVETIQAKAAIPAPDYSTNNAALVETIKAKVQDTDLSEVFGSSVGDAVLGLIAAATNAITPQSIGAQERFGENPPGFLDAGVRYAYAAGIAYSDGQYRPIEDTYAEKYEVEDLHDQVNSLGDHYNEISGTVSAWQTYWDGDDVRVTVTNYYGNLGTPSLYLEQKMPADETHESSWFKTIWDERTRWNAFLEGYASLTNHIHQNLADRAWGLYDSSTGTYSPDGLLQLSQDQIMIAPGMSYQKTVTAGGNAYWVLRANDPTTVSGVTRNGFFRIEDFDGNALVEIVKGDKRIVGANIASINKAGDVVTLTFNVNSDEHPDVYFTDRLSSGEWRRIESHGASVWLDYHWEVEWSGTPGAWIASITWTRGFDVYPFDHPPPSTGFFRATYEAGGNTYIRNNVATSIDKVVVGGIEYTVTVETVNGRKLMVLQ